jgi:hypothetical protein
VQGPSRRDPPFHRSCCYQELPSWRALRPGRRQESIGQVSVQLATSSHRPQRLQNVKAVAICGKCKV